MADPATMALFALGSSVAGGVSSAVGAYSSGQSQKQMYDYQAQVAQINAQIAAQNSDYAIAKGELDAQSYGLQAGQRSGQIIASQASSGLNVNSGSAANVQSSQKTITGMDFAQIRSNAAKTAYDYRVQGVSDTNQATLDIAAGKNAAAAGDINAVSSILGTAGSVSSKWLQGNQVGLWGVSGNAGGNAGGGLLGDG